MAYSAQLFSDLRVGDQFAFVTTPGAGPKIASIDNSFRFKVSSTEYVSIQPGHNDVNGVYLLGLFSEGHIPISAVVGDPEVMRIAKVV
jgi:hypothetical protein